MSKVGIVLGGGGARGPYHIGVWQALQQLGISFDIVTGTSVGALNGAMMVQGNLDAARALWETLTPTGVMADLPPDYANFSTSRRAMLGLLRHSVDNGGMDISPLEAILRENIDEEMVRSSPIEYGLVTAQYPLLKPVQLLKEQIPQGELVDYLLASAAFFPFFQRREIGGAKYVDGAYTDNLPAQLALKCGAKEIIAVDLQAAGVVHPIKTEFPVVYIRCYWDLGMLLSFDPALARRNIALGYADCMKAYRKLEGDAYAFQLGQSRENALRLGPILDRIARRTGVSLFKQYDRLLQLHHNMRYRVAGAYEQQRSTTLGHAVTAAAEIAGEILEISPQPTYLLTEFNYLLWERFEQLRHQHQGVTQLDPTFLGIAQRKPHLTLHRIWQLLRKAYIAGSVSDAFWRITAIAPKEFVAAYYLFALDLYERQGRGEQLL